MLASEEKTDDDEVERVDLVGDLADDVRQSLSFLEARLARAVGIESHGWRPVPSRIGPV